MATEPLRTDLVAKLEDLIKQATTERSHFYVATVAGEAVREIQRLRAAVESSARGRREFQGLCREMLDRLEKIP